MIRRVCVYKLCIFNFMRLKTVQGICKQINGKKGFLNKSSSFVKCMEFKNI